MQLGQHIARFAANRAFDRVHASAHHFGGGGPPMDYARIWQSLISSARAAFCLRRRRWTGCCARHQADFARADLINQEALARAKMAVEQFIVIGGNRHAQRAGHVAVGMRLAQAENRCRPRLRPTTGGWRLSGVGVHADMAALVGVIAGQERAQVFHGQLRQAVFGDRQPAFVGQGFDQGANIEVVQGARGRAMRSAASREAIGVLDMAGSWSEETRR